MSPDDIDTFRKASELYRYALAEILPKFTGPQPTQIEQYLDELKEALLDLKQATIGLDVPLVAKYTDEVGEIIADLLSPDR
jgi:hypothetical protein